MVVTKLSSGIRLADTIPSNNILMRLSKSGFVVFGTCGPLRSFFGLWWINAHCSSTGSFVAICSPSRSATNDFRYTLDLGGVYMPCLPRRGLPIATGGNATFLVYFLIHIFNHQSVSTNKARYVYILIYGLFGV